MLREFMIEEVSEWGNSIAFYISDRNNIVLADSELGDILKIFDLGGGATLGNGQHILRPATRAELKAAGLWDMVINKDDFSCKEDELEEYLRIAEEKEKK